MQQKPSKKSKETQRPRTHARALVNKPKALVFGAVVCILVFALLCITCRKPAKKSKEPSSSDIIPASTQAVAVDSSVPVDEREQYIEVWAERIDAYNAGFPLEGYGATFAAAAYDYGIDPRYSPAIARVESGSGTNCFHPCNAWGWGSSSWPDWDTAIYAHVRGLAEGYGYTLSYNGALKYNSSSPDEWYGLVRNCMDQIWPTDG